MLKYTSEMFPENVHPLNLISVLKFKMSSSSFSFNADFQNKKKKKKKKKKKNAEVPFTPSYLELCLLTRAIHKMYWEMLNKDTVF